MNGEYRKYLPFMVSVYEGGLMAYPLYTSLCGQENLSQIAVLDIAGLLFGFSIYMGMLGQVENGEKINAKKLCMSAFHTPAFIASVLGILAGLSKVVICLIDSPFGGAYLAVEGILTTSVTAIILIVVGYSMELTKELIRPCLKTILMRVVKDSTCAKIAHVQIEDISHCFSCSDAASLTLIEAIFFCLSLILRCLLLPAYHNTPASEHKPDSDEY